MMLEALNWLLELTWLWEAAVEVIKCISFALWAPQWHVVPLFWSDGGHLYGRRVPDESTLINITRTQVRGTICVSDLGRTVPLIRRKHTLDQYQSEENNMTVNVKHLHLGNNPNQSNDNIFNFFIIIHLNNNKALHFWYWERQDHL